MRVKLAVSTSRSTEVILIDPLGGYSFTLLISKRACKIFCAGLRMERRNSYCKWVNASTAATRIADARNKRETLLFAEASKRFSSKTDRTIRTFYKEKAKENNFLKKVRRRSSGILITKSEEQGDVVSDRKISLIAKNEARSEMKDQKARRSSMEDDHMKMQKRIQEFLTQDLPGSRPKHEQDRQLNEENIKNELGQEDFNHLDFEGSEDDSETSTTSMTPFKVRSRTSGICFSHSHCQQLHLPPINLPDVTRRCSVTELRRNSFCNFSKTQCRKLSASIPIMVDQWSLERQKLMTSMPPINPPRGAMNETSRGVIW